jgi:hypothetical protein
MLKRPAARPATTRTIATTALLLAPAFGAQAKDSVPNRVRVGRVPHTVVIDD